MNAAGTQITISGVFKRAKIKGIPKYGRYSGKGLMILTNNGIQIIAKRVHKCAVGVIIPFVLLAGIVLINHTIAFMLWLNEHHNEEKASEALGQGILRAAVFSLIAFGIWKLMTKRENLFWPYAQLRCFAVNQQKQIIALDFNTPDKYTPMAIRCHNWQEVEQMLRTFVPQCEIPPGQ